MTPEQFDALVEMIGGLANAKVTREKFSGQLNNQHFIGNANEHSDKLIADARKLLVVEPPRELTGWLFVTEPPRELTGCQHLRGFRVEAVNGSRWSCCGEAYGP